MLCLYGQFLRVRGQFQINDNDPQYVVSSGGQFWNAHKTTIRTFGTDVGPKIVTSEAIFPILAIVFGFVSYVIHSGGFGKQSDGSGNINQNFARSQLKGLYDHVHGLWEKYRKPILKYTQGL